MFGKLFKKNKNEDFDVENNSNNNSQLYLKKG